MQVHIDLETMLKALSEDEYKEFVNWCSTNISIMTSLVEQIVDGVNQDGWCGREHISEAKYTTEFPTPIEHARRAMWERAEERTKLDVKECQYQLRRITDKYNETNNELWELKRKYEQLHAAHQQIQKDFVNAG